MVLQEIKPGRVYYLLAAFVLVAGVAIFVFVLLKGIGGITDKLVQMEAPGTAEMNFTETGKYTIFYEPESTFNGQVYNTRNSFSGVWCTVISKDTNRPVALSQPSTNTTYTVGGRSGMSILEFEINSPGTYEVTASYRDNPNRPKIVLAVGSGVASAIVSTVVIGLAVMFGTVIIAAVIAIVTFVKRRKAKRGQLAGGYPQHPMQYHGP